MNTIVDFTRFCVSFFRFYTQTCQNNINCYSSPVGGGNAHLTPGQQSFFSQLKQKKKQKRQKLEQEKEFDFSTTEDIFRTIKSSFLS